MGENHILKHAEIGCPESPGRFDEGIIQVMDGNGGVDIEKYILGKGVDKNDSPKSGKPERNLFQGKEGF